MSGEKKYCELLIADDYKRARKDVSDIVIAPFDEKKAKGVGYNLAPSMLAYSVNKKRLLKIKENEKEVYVEIPPQDTLLTLSREYLVVSENIAGTFHSKVRSSAMGLGSVSTTLDPGWSGKLLFAINNPTKKKIKLTIEEKSSGNRNSVGLVTMVLNRICIKNSDDKDKEKTGNEQSSIKLGDLQLDNPPMRTDIWQDLTERPAGIHNAAEYERFQKIINDITEFKAPKGEYHAQMQKIIDIVIRVRQDVLMKKSLGEIRAEIIPLEEVITNSKDPRTKELKDKFKQWKTQLEGATQLEELHNQASQEIEEGILKECHYLMLCEEVRLQDEFIRNRIKRYWGGEGLTFVWKKLTTKENIKTFLTSVAIGVCLFVGKAPISEVATLCYASLPVLVSIMAKLIFNWTTPLAEDDS